MWGGVKGEGVAGTAERGDGWEGCRDRQTVVEQRKNEGRREGVKRWWWEVVSLRVALCHQCGSHFRVSDMSSHTPSRFMRRRWEGSGAGVRRVPNDKGRTVIDSASRLDGGRVN